LMTYGDDNIMGVAPEVTNFDHTIMQKQLAGFNVKYTMADKLAESVPFINIKDASFLKRGWRFEPELGSHVAQIEHDSIQKMLTRCLPSKTICMEAHSIEVMGSAIREYFFYGREIFEQKRAMFLDIIREKELEPYYLTEFPSWAELVQSYFQNSEHIAKDGKCSQCVLLGLC